MGTGWSRLSKAVGWNPPTFPMPYPPLADVEKAFADKNYYQLLVWYRFLTSPENEEQVATINRINELTMEARKILEAENA